ncbi:apolipoprotein C-II [Clarias gariepinus]|uniref:apolipoprotein C-II n=1 Tax=Clarias gariepinus TaxID=13013 RepID=UPI00234CC42B|nr:apolipoprotein C-II [Clarias gariepinus]
MNKLLFVSVLITVFVLGAESFRVPRQAPEEEEQNGPVTYLLDQLRGYYDYSLKVAGSVVESIKELKLEEKAKNVYSETTGAARTYLGIAQDQLYHMVYPDSA